MKEIRRNETISNALIKPTQMSSMSPSEIMERVLDHSVEISGSRFGYIAYLSNDGSVLRVHHYSDNAMEIYRRRDRVLSCDVDSAGV